MDHRRIEEVSEKLPHKVVNSPKILKKVTVEPLLMITMFTIVLYTIVSQQYVYYKISKYYGTNNVSQTSLCGSNNVSNATKELHEKVSAESSAWILYLNVAGFIPSFFCTVIIGTWGDVVGRKPPLFLSFFGLFGMIITYLVVIKCELHVAYLLIGRIFAGMFGDMNSILCSCYAYFADTSSLKNRTFKMAIGEASTGIGGFIASVISGIWIDTQGFLPPLWLLFGLLLGSLLYIVFILPESQEALSSSNHVPLSKVRSLFSCHHFVALWEFLSENWNKTWKILAIIACFFLQLCVHDGTGDIVVVYELSPPLCWSSSLIGYGSAVRDSSYLFGVLTIKLLSQRISDFVFILLSSLSTTSSLIWYAFASVTWMMFTGYAFAIFRTVSATVLRSMLSRLVGKDSQGSSFALVACAESLASLIASFIFNGIYSASVGDFRGTVFLVGAGMQVIFFILLSFIYIKVKHELVANEAEEYLDFQNELAEEYQQSSMSSSTSDI